MPFLLDFDGIVEVETPVKSRSETKHTHPGTESGRGLLVTNDFDFPFRLL